MLILISFCQKCLYSNLRNEPETRFLRKFLILEQVYEKVKSLCILIPVVEEPEITMHNLKNDISLLIQNLHVSESERNHIAYETVGQFENPLFLEHKKNRMTSSRFGKIINRKAYTPCHNDVKSILRPQQFFSEATEYGIQKESVALALFSKKTGLNVTPTGLWIDLNYGYLGASPDGLIDDDSIVEVKCLPSCAKLKCKNIEEILNLKKNTCLTKINGDICLKRKHQYYYQIQGQLNITGRSKCFFVVYIDDTIEIFVEEILKDEHLWQTEMLPKLKQFYLECVAPEIFRNNLIRNKKCVDPPFIQNAIDERHNKISKI